MQCRAQPLMAAPHKYIANLGFP